MATLEQLQRALVNADAAGDAEGAAILAREIQAMQGSMPQEQPQPEAPTSYEQSYLGQIGSGLNEGLANVLGFPVDAANNFLVAPALWGINQAFGTDYKPSSEPLGGSAGLAKGLEIYAPTEDAGKQAARRVSRAVGAASVPVGYGARTAGELAAGLGTAIAGGAGGAATERMYPNNPAASDAVEMVVGALAGGGIGAAANRAAQKAQMAAIPSVQQLKEQAGALYRKAESSGVMADPQMTSDLAGQIKKIARDNELITPKGRVSTAYPRAAEAMNLLDDYAGFDMNPTQMQVIRETLADAVMSTEGKERRIAAQMLRTFDDFTAPLAPELDQARALYQRAMKGQKLEQLEELGDASASQYSASGRENSMRQQYRALDKAIIKGQEVGWSPSEVQAIRDVGRGTTAQNAMRNVGRIAPTGPVSGATTFGIPFMVGTAMGGPSVGAAMGAGMSGVGYGARSLASAMQQRNIEIAKALARNGGTIPYAQNENVINAIAAALGSQSANANEVQR